MQWYWASFWACIYVATMLYLSTLCFSNKEPHIPTIFTFYLREGIWVWIEGLLRRWEIHRTRKFIAHVVLHVPQTCNFFIAASHTALKVLCTINKFRLREAKLEHCLHSTYNRQYRTFTTTVTRFDFRCSGLLFTYRESRTLDFLLDAGSISVPVTVEPFLLLLLFLRPIFRCQLKFSVFYGPPPPSPLVHRHRIFCEQAEARIRLYE